MTTNDSADPQKPKEELVEKLSELTELLPNDEESTEESGFGVGVLEEALHRARTLTREQLEQERQMLEGMGLL
jgi:hypothetical protein